MIKNPIKPFTKWVDILTTRHFQIQLNERMLHEKYTWRVQSLTKTKVNKLKNFCKILLKITILHIGKGTLQCSS